jgi:hypothetical protein
LQSCTLSDLVAIDKTYLSKIELRRKLIATETDNVLDCNPVATEAVRELYEWIFGTYLPKRFPTMFSLVPSTFEKQSQISDSKGQLHNRVTGECIPLEPPNDPVEAMKTLGSHVDDEFLILLPISDPNAKPLCALPAQTPTCPYYLHAFILTFPSGFNTPQKLGLPLAGEYHEL